MRKVWLFAVILCFLQTFETPASHFRVESSGKEVETLKTAVEIVRSDPDEILIDLEFGGFDVQEHDAGDQVFQKVVLPGEDEIRKPGYPALPRILRKLIIDDRKRPVIEILDQEEVIHDGYNILPAPEPRMDDSSSVSFELNERVYDSLEPYPLQSARIRSVSVWRDFRIADIEIFPVRAVPRENRLLVTLRMRIAIRYDGEGGENVKLSDAGPISPLRDRLYETALMNYRDIRPSVAADRSEIPSYLIIAADEYSSGIEPLAEYYRSCGFQVKISPLSETGNEKEDIHESIRRVYETEGLDYCLLAGDIARIPIHECYSHMGDHYYACLEGDDPYPEISVGRFSVTSLEELSHQVQRTLNYLLEPEDASFWEYTLLCAHEEEYPLSYTKDKNLIAEYPYSRQMPVAIKVYPPEGGTREDVIDALCSGVGLVNYRGHGSSYSWTWDPGWDTDDVDLLENGARTPHVFNIACHNASLDADSPCLAEAWLSTGSDGQNGAVTALAATRASFTDENSAYDKEIYKLIFDAGTGRIGDVVYSAKSVMIPMSEMGEFNARTYLLLGDPACCVRTMQPSELTVDYPESMYPGSAEFSVTVTENGSPSAGTLVCVSLDEQKVQAQYTDEQGQAEFNFYMRSLGELIITATAQNSYQYQGTVGIIPPECGVMAFDRDYYGCEDQAYLTVWDTGLNVDPYEAETVSVSISSTTDSEGLTVLLVETGMNTSEFAGSVVFSCETSPETLQVSHGDAVTALYEDADCNGSSEIAEAESTIDCESPAIYDLNITDIENDNFTVEWTTDEPASTVITYGPSVPPGFEYRSDELVTEHFAEIRGLNEDTCYYASFGSSDAAGNRTLDDAGGQFHVVRTRKLQVVLEDHFETYSGWVEEGDGQWENAKPEGKGQWMFGAPDPDHDHTSGEGKIWGTDVTEDGRYDLESDCSLISPPFCCSNISHTRLYYWDWLNLTYKSGLTKVFLDIDAGEGWQNIWTSAGNISTGDWDHREFDISSWADGRPVVRIRFRLYSHGRTAANSGWNIDDLKIQGYFVEPSQDLPSNLGVDLDISKNIFCPGDEFILKAIIGSDGQDRGGMPLAVLLEAMGEYWVWPDWVPFPANFQFVMTAPGKYGLELNVLGPFNWPDTGRETVSGLYFHGALLNSAFNDIQGEWDSVQFGYAPE